MDFPHLWRAGIVWILLYLLKDLNDRHIQGCEVVIFKLLMRFKIWYLLLLRLFLLLLLRDLGGQELGLPRTDDTFEIFLLVYELLGLVHKLLKGV